MYNDLINLRRKDTTTVNTTIARAMINKAEVTLERLEETIAFEGRQAAIEALTRRVNELIRELEGAIDEMSVEA